MAYTSSSVDVAYICSNIADIVYANIYASLFFDNERDDKKKFSSNKKNFLKDYREVLLCFVI